MYIVIVISIMCLCVTRIMYYPKCMLHLILLTDLIEFNIFKFFAC